MLQSDRDADIIDRILEDADVLQQRIKYFSLTEEAFCNDRSFEGELAYDAVMNPVYRIAEDAIHLSDDVISACPDIPWKNIRGFRNFIAHGYAEIDRAIAWKVVVGDIPELVSALEQLAQDCED